MPHAAGLQFPYVEGLRMDEAMHPLALLTVGMFGETLPPQDGAPVRMILPWKYGFKSIKSIVKIKLVGSMPPTSWNIANPPEYGFYSNVNPESGPSALEPGAGAAFGRIPQAAHADVQRLRRPGGQPVRRHGPEEILLSHAETTLDQDPGVRCQSRCRCSGWPGARVTRISPPIRSSTSPISRAIGPSASSCSLWPSRRLRKLLGAAGPDPLPPHDRPVRVLLRFAALCHLHLARQVFRRVGDAEGRREAAIHHRGVHGISC